LRADVAFCRSDVAVCSNNHAIGDALRKLSATKKSLST
jgi:hypothetical protein